ncbi:MAG: hypothetical protein D6813_05630 [Calditrichaeota bacterium]|nr:MAG: hypothetical protein D6813_05630 [Calditrichota bacterium]
MHPEEEVLGPGVCSEGCFLAGESPHRGVILHRDFPARFEGQDDMQNEPEHFSFKPIGQMVVLED